MEMSAKVCLDGHCAMMRIRNVRSCSFAGDLDPKAYLDDHKASTAVVGPYEVDIALVARNVEATNAGDALFKLLSRSSAGKPEGEGNKKDRELHT